MSDNAKLNAWAREIEAICQPDATHWCDGSDAENSEMIRLMLDAGTARKLDEARRPNSYLVRSDPADVARVEDRTFICSAREQDANSFRGSNRSVPLVAHQGPGSDFEFTDGGRAEWRRCLIYGRQLA